MTKERGDRAVRRSTRPISRSILTPLPALAGGQKVVSSNVKRHGSTIYLRCSVRELASIAKSARPLFGELVAKSGHV